ncbi:hypothetical protein [Gymnodinialimonas hymeniacidonis]|uniref:hypothetical protein n=1 Tax=Gymnodinialimonas hymeniacidonis TaxID=3126508 RepID=UPI0034C6AB1B
MSERPTASSLFFGAIGDLLTNFGAVLRIGAPWFLIYLALNALAGRFYAHWVLYDVNQISPGPPNEWYLTAMFLLMLGTVAASWHRFMTLGETPRFLPQMRLVIILKYVLAWVVIGIIIGSILLVCLGLPALLLSALVDQAFQDVIAGLLQDSVFVPSGLSVGLIGLALFFVFLVVTLSILLLYRMGIGLPSVAILDGEGIGMRASWRATRGMGGAILGASLISAIGSVILYGVVFSGFFLPSESYSTATEVTMRLGFAVTDIITMLVGTAILTRIYQAVPEESL